MNIKKRIFLFVAILILIFCSRLWLKSNLNSKLSDTCLTTNFETVFSQNLNIELNSKFNFNKLFNCHDWNKILIVEAPYVNRTLIYLSSGVLLPDYNYKNIVEGTYLLFFLDGNTPINKPIKFGRSDFIFSNNFNKFNYFKTDRKNSQFIYMKFEDSDYNFFTLKLLKE